MSIQIPQSFFSVQDLVSAVRAQNLERIRALLDLYRQTGWGENLTPALLAAVEGNNTEIFFDLQHTYPLNRQVVTRAFELGSTEIIDMISQDPSASLDGMLLVAAKHRQWHVIEHCLDLPVWQTEKNFPALFDPRVLEQAIWEEEYPLLMKILDKIPTDFVDDGQNSKNTIGEFPDELVDKLGFLSVLAEIQQTV